jgi:hypothetical protein
MRLTNQVFAALLLALVVIVSSFTHPLQQSIHLKKSALSRGRISPLFVFKNDRYVSPLMEERLRNGLLRPADLERMFAPSEKDFDYIERSGVKGFAGVIFGLDSCLVDLHMVIGYTYATFAGELGQPTPDPMMIRDIMGCSLREGILSLGWAVPLDRIPALKMRFYQIMDKFMDAIPVSSLFD